MNACDIAKEIEKAHNDYLQDQWDRWLIEGWTKYKSVGMPKTINIFCFKHGITDEKFFSLKRTPKKGMHLKCSLTRYIAAYLPLLNTMLWNGVKTENEMAKIIKAIDTDPWPSDSSKVTKEDYEFKKSAKEAMAEKVSSELVREQRASNGRRNWNACK